MGKIIGVQVLQKIELMGLDLPDLFGLILIKIGGNCLFFFQVIVARKVPQLVHRLINVSLFFADDVKIGVVFLLTF